jgi:hypothetical protein
MLACLTKTGRAASLVPPGPPISGPQTLKGLAGARSIKSGPRTVGYPCPASRLGPQVLCMVTILLRRRRHPGPSDSGWSGLNRRVFN